MQYNTHMRTCLGLLLLFFIIVALIGTVTYHACVNTELSFEQKAPATDFKNYERSYVPEPPPLPTPTTETQQNDAK